MIYCKLVACTCIMTSAHYQPMPCFYRFELLVRITRWICSIQTPHLAALCPDTPRFSGMYSILLLKRLRDNGKSNWHKAALPRLCLCACVSVCLSLASLPRYNSGYSLGNDRGCPLVMHYWADLQSVHGFRCYDNIARTRNVSECLYSLYAWLYFWTGYSVVILWKLAHTFAHYAQYAQLMGKQQKALTQGRTDHFCNTLATVNFRLALTYLQFSIQV